MKKLEVDTSRLPLLLHELRLPAIGRLWPDFAARADKEGWPAARFLSALAEIEIAERARRRIERHLAESRLPPGKTLDNFDFAAVPMLSKAHVTALAAGDTWLEKGANLLVFGPPGSGKSHLAAARAACRRCTRSVVRSARPGLDRERLPRAVADGLLFRGQKSPNRCDTLQSCAFKTKVCSDALAMLWLSRRPADRQLFGIIRGDVQCASPSLPAP
jgi:hypothetical protein